MVVEVRVGSCSDEARDGDADDVSRSGGRTCSARETAGLVGCHP